MLRRCASVALSLAGIARQRAPVVRGPQHHHAVLDIAIAAIDHRKALDLALAAASVTNSGTARLLRSASACTLVSCFSASLRRSPRQHQRMMLGDEAALAVEQAELAAVAQLAAPSRRPHASCRC